MSVTPMSYNPMLKPSITAGIAIADDKFLLNEQDLPKSLKFGVAVAIGTTVGNFVGNQLPVLIPSMINNNLYDAKTSEIRLAEVGVGAVSAYAINTNVIKNDFDYDLMYTKLAIVAGSDFLAEHIVDYLENRPLSFFK